jgi:uncharacterized membrane protein
MKGMVIVMNRQSFITELRAYLTGKVDTLVIEETISYYQDYFDQTMKEGLSEEAIAEQLGNPRLLGKTIVQTQQNRTSSVEQENEESRQNDHNPSGNGYRLFNLPKWSFILILICVIIVSIMLLTSIISLFLYLLVPIIIILALYLGIKYLIQLFRS